MSTPPPNRHDAVEFDTVFREELDWIATRRQHLVDRGWLPPWSQTRPGDIDKPIVGTRPVLAEAGSQDRQTTLDSDLCGLAISGGGIRSATFALGVLQGLAMSHLLPRFDYLSTVSGGGYIGAWFSSWIHRSSFPDVLSRLLPPAARPKDREGEGAPPAEPKEITHLRFYSNYLAPRPGIFSLDGWVLVAIFLRNLLLNQAVLLLAILSLFLAIRLVVEIFAIAYVFNVHGLLPYGLGVMVAAAAGWAAWQTAALAPTWAEPTADYPQKFKWRAIISWLAAAILAALLLTTRQAQSWISFDHPARTALCFAAAFAALHAALGWWWMRRKGQRWRGQLRGAGAGMFAGLIGGVVQFLLLTGLYRLSGAASFVAGVATFGVPVVLLGLVLTNFLQVGFIARITSGFEREWWSSHNARLMMAAAFWCATFLISVYAPAAIALLLTGIWTASLLTALTSGWAGTTLAGLFAANTKGVRGTLRDGLREWLARIAPYVFVVGLLALVAFATTWLVYEAYALLWKNADWRLFSRLDRQLTDLNEPSPLLPPPDAWLEWHWMKPVNSLLTLLALAGSSLGVWLVSWWLGRGIGVNRFTLQNLYANRLVRCYLGATRDRRKPNPITNFDPQDDLKLSALAPRYADAPPPDRQRLPATLPRPRASRALRPQTADRFGPLHIVNAALNRSAGEVAGGNEAQTLAFLERKAESFVFTPLYCGNDSTRYCLTREFAEDLNYSAAISTSGAAVSPNMGFYSSTAVTILLTAFNVRLGAWFGSPTEKKLRWSVNPPASWELLVRELTADMSPDKGYVYLSDGGHFENLGVYELVRRRCRFIVVIDSGADPRFLRENLGNLVRKVRIDFGIGIDIDICRTQTDAQGRVQSHVAVGRIRYGDVTKPRGASERPFGDPRFCYEQNDDGILLYLKTGLTGDEAPDLLNYAAQCPDFPNQATLDQFYSESQFESYRALGVHTARILLDGVKFQLPGDNQRVLKPGPRFGYDLLKQLSTRRIFEDVYNHWLEKPPQFIDDYVEQNELYLKLIDKLRTEPQLTLLAQELYGTLAEKEQAARTLRPPELALAERLMVIEMMTLLESACLSLNLEQEWLHPVHEGWITVFKNWLSSAAFCKHWPDLEHEFSPAFRQFVALVRQQISLPPGP